MHIESTTQLAVNHAAEHVRKLVPAPLNAPRVAIICGSGLGGLQHAVDSEGKVELPYDDIPGFMKIRGEKQTTKQTTKTKS